MSNTIHSLIEDEDMTILFEAFAKNPKAAVRKKMLSTSLIYSNWFQDAWLADALHPILINPITLFLIASGSANPLACTKPENSYTVIGRHISEGWADFCTNQAEQMYDEIHSLFIAYEAERAKDHHEDSQYEESKNV